MRPYRYTESLITLQEFVSRHNVHTEESVKLSCSLMTMITIMAHDNTRKTFNFGQIVRIKDKVNGWLEKTECMAAQRLLCSMLEEILWQVQEYHGYGYNKWLNGGYKAWQASGESEFNRTKYMGSEYDRYYF